MGSGVGAGGRGGRETRGTSPGGGVLGLDVVGALGSFESPGGSGLGKEEIGTKSTYLGFQVLVQSLQYHN